MPGAAVQHVYAFWHNITLLQRFNNANANAFVAQ
jgi:hypothetical protein